MCDQARACNTTLHRTATALRAFAADTRDDQRTKEARASMYGRMVRVAEGNDPDVSGKSVIIKRTDSDQYVVFPVGEIGAVIQELEAIRRRYES